MIGQDLHVNPEKSCESCQKWLSGLDRRKFNDESREFSFFAFDIDRAAEVTDDAEADTQT